MFTTLYKRVVILTVNATSMASKKTRPYDFVLCCVSLAGLHCLELCLTHVLMFICFYSSSIRCAAFVGRLAVKLEVKKKMKMKREAC